MQFTQTLFLASLALMMQSSWVTADEQHTHDHGHNHAHHHGAQKTSIHNASSLHFADTPVVTHQNKKMNFYQDLVKNKTVAINFIYTSCKTACPVQGAVFSQVQDKLKSRLNKDIFLISVSIDPKIDSPKKLKAWGKKFKQSKGWTLVTGNKTKINDLLKSIDMFSAITEDHSPTVLIGNDKRGVWKRVNGLSSPNKLAEIIQNIADNKGI